MCVVPRQVYCYDTTMLPDKFHLTVLLDLSSFVIVAYLRTKNEPTSDELTHFFSTYFTPELTRKCKIIHSDKCGAHLKQTTIEFFTNKGILVSHTDFRHTNQVVESSFAYIKKCIANNKFVGFDDAVEYPDLPESTKEEFIKQIIDLYNNNETAKESICLHGFSRNLLDIAKLYLYDLEPLELNNRIILAKSDSREGNFISNWNKLLLETFKLVLLQSKLNENNKEFTINLITKQNLKDLKQLVSTNDFNALNNISTANEAKKGLLEFILSENKSNKQRTISKEYILEKLKENLFKRMQTNISLEEKSKLELEYEFELLLLNQKDSETYNEKLDELNFKLSQAEIERDLYKNQIEKNNALLEEITSEKNRRIERRKVRQTMQGREKYAVFPEDYNLINAITKEGENKFIISKYRLLHLILFITGMRIGNIKYVDFEQLDKIFNNQSMEIKLIKTRKNKTLIFPYVNGMKKYLDLFRKDYEYLKLCQKNNDLRLYKVDKMSAKEAERNLSEIWGYANRSSMTDYVNKQLSKVGEILRPKKKLTLHSYRRGIAILTIRLFDIAEAKYILGHEKITSTEAYMEKVPEFKRIKNTYDCILRYKNSKDIKSKRPMTEAEEDAAVIELERMLRNDRDFRQDN